MAEKDLEQAKKLLDDFNSFDEQTQDKLLNGVKSLAWLYSLAETKDDADNKSLDAQPA